MIFGNYFKQSKSPLYSFIFILPLFIIYELGISFIPSEDIPTIRNGADVILRKILETLGINSIYGIAVALMIGVILAFFINRGKFKDLKINNNYILFMIIESIFWAFVLLIILSQGQLLLAKGTSKLLLQQIVLSIGSGIFEEFVFRVLLVSGFALLIGIFTKKYWTKMTISIALAAIIFSLFHFVGELADIPTFNLFILRFGAGLALGFLYILRGFGITAYAHSFYNLLVFTQIQPDV